MEPGERSRCSDWGFGPECLQIQESILKIDQTFSGVSGYLGCFSGVKQLGHEVDRLLASRLRMSGAIPLLPLYAFITLTGTTSPSTFFPSTAAPHSHQRYYNSV